MEPAVDEAIKRALNSFRGKMAGYIESEDLPLKQERRMVSHMKNLSYECEKAIKNSVKGVS